MKFRGSFLLLMAACSIAPATSVHDDLIRHHELMVAVDHAVAVIEARGSDGFKDLYAYRFCRGEGYVVITDMHGIVLFHPIFPQLAGKDQTLIRDSRGAYCYAEMKARYAREESGWLSIWWPNPKTGQVDRKCIYFRRAVMGGMPVVVHAGLFGVADEGCR
ncbi:MAG TPA: cache domain-containing protein [Deltaproteobacteria bacterium]|nr:cache domain-containing protein [Deltaproteobacteria bacterium]HPR55734.1 cache domain-containing protein [Deltaproteobacteria bacterium]HXK47319.1 cache domain-containing protein [Deltaproteobacteria bacterium]